MAVDDTKRFTFVSRGLPEDTFAVVKFKGAEAISGLYEFEVTLASEDSDIDLKEVLQNTATLSIKGGDHDRPIHGILAEFEQLHEVKAHYFYRALLVPRLWQADLYRENQLFLDQTVPEIIEEIMRQTGLSKQDYELKLTKNYPQWEYICQYRETDFDFISRWMEREGIYYFFEQAEHGERLIITDSSAVHNDIPDSATISYFPPSGLVPEEEAIKAFICRQKRLPKKVILKDYNYRKPSLDLKAEAEVDSRGRANVYYYGEHFKTPEEGNELAKIRAEEIKCREKVFHGEGTASNLCPGFFYELDGHYRQDYNRKFLIVEVEHQGSQTGSFWAGVDDEQTAQQKELTYSNSFTAIPSDVQFRSELKTPKSRFYGTMNATVDAAGNGQYAELDEEGRYKIKLPFDQSDADGGKASRWVRMSQPYAGAEHGMHFPLHKGTEVLLTFVDGDPDRPIISGAVPNYETKSPVTAANQSESVIQTGGRNKIRIEDKVGSERIIMETPAAKSWIRMGMPNDPDVYVEDKDSGPGIKIKTKASLVERSKGKQKVILKPNREYNDLTEFDLSDDTYLSIEKDLKKEIAHIKENIRILDIFLGTVSDPEGELVMETNAEVLGKYQSEKEKLVKTKRNLKGFEINNNDKPTKLNRLVKRAQNKDDFVEKVEGKKFVKDQKANAIIVSVILRNTINAKAKHRVIEISGDQLNETDGSHKITAINGERRIEMTDQGIYIDAGEDRDITLKCRNFFLKNKDEDNITYGDDYAVHYGPNEVEFYGTNTETFHGKSIETFYGEKYEEFHGNAKEHFFGDKLETHIGTSGDWYFGHKIEGFGGSHESLSFIHDFELFMGIKEEIVLLVAFSINPALLVEWNLAEYSNTTFDLSDKKFKFKKGEVEIDGKTIKLGQGFVIQS